MPVSLVFAYACPVFLPLYGNTENPLVTGHIPYDRLVTVKKWKSNFALVSVSHLVSQQKNLLNKIYLKFHSNLMQRFRVDLETFLGLAMPNQYCHAVIN